MAPPGGAGVARALAPPQQGQGQGQQGFGKVVSTIMRMAVFWYLASLLFGPKKPSDPALLINNLIPKGQPLDMWLYLSEDKSFTDFGSQESLIWHETNFLYATWGADTVRRHHVVYDPSEIVSRNASVYAHTFFARSGYTPDPNDPEYDPWSFTRSHPVVIHLPKPKVDKRKSLWGGVNGDQEPREDLGVVTAEVDEEITSSEFMPFWKPNITINLVEDFTRYSKKGLPPHVADNLIIDYSTGNYFPTIFYNEFWLMRDKLVVVNESVRELQLNLELSPMSLMKWQLFLQIDQSFQIHRSYGSMMEDEADELKRVFLEGNPYLLVITMLVSLLHTVFDVLAFKNDIQFWNKNKSMEGLSAKSVVVSFICQLIVFLYLLDNETSWMILASAGIGCCIEFWKIGKAMHIEVDRSHGFPMLRFRDRDSYAGNKTKEYDDIAMKYLSYLLFFLVICSSIYSLMYERHKSWYSWILSSCTSCVYMFGFIMMCPQLFINYKLKSVAHLPWRQMTYKFLNTIIDDLFAFVIKMPVLHRLSVFRDDVVFLIYLYQRWIYPVDKSRVNEYGFGGDSKEGSTEGTEGNTEGTEDLVAKSSSEHTRAVSDDLQESKKSK